MEGVHFHYSQIKIVQHRFLYPGLIWRFQKIFGIGSEKMLKESLQIVETYMNNAVSDRKESLRMT
jgi:fatty acid omega-hydroxylase